MHDLSFTPKNTYFNFTDLKFSVEVFTFNNIYTADPDAAVFSENGFYSSGLLTSGGQEKAKGYISFSKSHDSYRVSARIEGKKVRCIKLAIDGLPLGFIDGTIDCKPRSVDDFGFILHYPEGWRELATPAVYLNTDDRVWYFWSMDNRVREKRFAFMKRDGKVRAELIFEEDATVMSSNIEAPVWRFGNELSENKEKILSDVASHVSKTYGLQPFDQRADVPSWLPDISLVIAAHCMHWTGYVFNKYEDFIPLIEYVTKKIDGKHVLLYLPGFEGRYYFDYGNYNAEERLGGEEGLHRLIDRAHELGVHVMLFFGINVVSTESEGYYEWGKPSLFVPAAGGECNHLDCDMDSARHYHHGSQGIVNPAAPKWQNHLVEEIISLRDEFSYDGAFLDIAAIWVNDSNYHVVDGIKRLSDRLRDGAPEFLVSGEAWYDGLAACMPFFHSGHTFGEMHYHDEFNEALFTPYCREFAHLSLGDPSRHSTGVHELGTNHTWRAPVRRGVIPTLTVVDGTLEFGKDGIDAIIDDALTYKKRYIENKD